MNRSKARYMLAQAGLIGLRGTPADMTRETIYAVTHMRSQWGYSVTHELSEFWALVTIAAYSLPPIPRYSCKSVT